MALLWWGSARSGPARAPGEGRPTAKLRLEALESRDPASSAVLAGGSLTVTGTAGNDHLLIRRDGATIVVLDKTGIIGRFASAAVAKITVKAGAGNDLVKIASDVTQSAIIDGGSGKNLLQAGGGATTIIGSDGRTKLVGGTGTNTLMGGSGDERFVGGAGKNVVAAAGNGADAIVRVRIDDLVTASPNDRIARNNPRPVPAADDDATITAGEVGQILRRAAAATASTDALIAIVDRNGRILGVRAEGGVAAEVMGTPATLVFAVDGAVSLARTGAFFGNNQAPLTSRTIRNLSQTTITEREVTSNPNDTNPLWRGPGFVAPVGIGAHFPPGVPNTPEVDLFAIEHTNRDKSVKGIRFNINPAFVPAGQELFAPDSYGVASGKMRDAQNRGIATLPGGIPLFKNGKVVGGIGVFFPGKTGYATEENSQLSTTFDPTKPDRSLEAEYIAFAAAGGSSAGRRSIGTLAGIARPAGFDLPFGRIDLVGITLDIFGPGGSEGIKKLVDDGSRLGIGSPDSGPNLPVMGANIFLLDGKVVPSGWLVSPHAGVGITAADVTRIVQNGIDQAGKTRAAIRQLGSSTRMVFAVCDRNGDIVGLYRMPDATVFSIDVAVAKARNVNYYADPAKLQAADRLPGVAAGTAFSNRTFRFLALPRFPSAAEDTPPGPFSILLDGGADPRTARQVGPRLPASAFQSVLGHDAFFPRTNFRDPTNSKNQNGIVFFPGSAPLYKGGAGLSGGFGVSGDGVDQDDVVTVAGQAGFEVVGVRRADMVFVNGVRLPYQKFNRNPEAV